MPKMKLYSLTDFPDDCSRVCYTRQMLDSMVGKLCELGVSRAYFQYYGGLEDDYMWNSENKNWKTMNETARLMPRMSKNFVDTCKKYGLETAGVMRPHEQGHWLAFSPFHGKSSKKEIPNVGGRIIDPSSFLASPLPLPIQPDDTPFSFSSSVAPLSFTVALEKSHDPCGLLVSRYRSICKNGFV